MHMPSVVTPAGFVFCQGKGLSLLHDKPYNLVHRNKGWRL